MTLLVTAWLGVLLPAFLALGTDIAAQARASETLFSDPAFLCQARFTTTESRESLPPSSSVSAPCSLCVIASGMAASLPTPLPQHTLAPKLTGSFRVAHSFDHPLAEISLTRPPLRGPPASV